MSSPASTEVPDYPRGHSPRELNPNTALYRAQECLYTHGSLRKSRELFELAYQEAEQRGSPADLAAAALGLSGLWVHERRGAAEAAQVQAQQRRALAALPPDGPWALRLTARLQAESVYFKGQPDALLRSLVRARELADPVALAEILNITHHCLLGPEHAQLRAELAAELLRAAASSKRPIDVLLGLFWSSINALLQGDPHTERFLREVEGALAKQPHEAVSFLLAAIRVTQDLRAGDFAHAERAAVTAAELGTRVGDVDACSWLSAQIFSIRWFQGRSAELLTELSDTMNSPAVSALDRAFCAAFAAGSALAQDRHSARAALARLSTPSLGALPSSSTWLTTLRGIAEAAFVLGDNTIAAEVYDLALPYADRPSVASLGATCFGSTAHTLGLAAATLGNLPRAITHFSAASQANLALHRPAAAHSEFLLGHCLLALGDPTGEKHLQTAQQTARRLGMLLPNWSISTARSPASAQPRSSIHLRRSGSTWTVQLGARAVELPHLIGLGYLAVLTANPGQEIVCTELLGGAHLLQRAHPSPTNQALLDDAAQQNYRARIQELSGQEPTPEVTAELTWLLAELSSASALSGHPRNFSDDSERARISVGRAIRRAITQIHRANPVIGQHLSENLHTGQFCCYRLR